jgi:hypothetical protein
MSSIASSFPTPYLGDAPKLGRARPYVCPPLTSLRRETLKTPALPRSPGGSNVWRGQINLPPFVKVLIIQ